MNSMQAAVNVSAQWHRRDTPGAIKHIGILNNHIFVIVFHECENMLILAVMCCC